MAACCAVWATPWGGKGGAKSWQFIIPDCAKLTQILIRSGDALDSIGFTYRDQCGTHTEKFGGNGGIAHTINLADNEVLIGISGRVGTYKGLTVITSLSFQTNIKNYGQYGTNGGTDFSFGVADGKFIGFYGKCGDYMDSFGIIVQPKT